MQKPHFSQNLFWDVDVNTLDIDKYPAQIIERVLQYGQWEDWKAVVAYYSLEKVKGIVLNLRDIDDKTLAFLSVVINEPQTAFRCYKHSRLTKVHWN